MKPDSLIVILKNVEDRLDEFRRENNFLCPNILLVPAENQQDLKKISELCGLKIIYAAIPEIKVGRVGE